MAERPSSMSKPRRRVPDAPEQDERVSLHGPAFEEVLKGLLAVDPDSLEEEGDDDGA